MSAAKRIEQMLLMPGAEEELISDSARSVKREQAIQFINTVAFRVRTQSEVPHPRIGLICRHRVETLLALIGIALAGAEVLLIDKAVALSAEQLSRDWQLSDIIDSASLAVESATKATDQRTGLLDYEVSTESAFFTILSSGTTGTPKGITHTFRSALGSAEDFASSLGVKRNDRFLHNWPMHYMAGIFNLFLCPMAGGASVHLADVFSAQNVRTQLEVIRRLECSQVLMSPTMANMLSRIVPDEGPNISNIKVVCTSSILYPSVASSFRDKFKSQLRPCYGITEYGGSFTLGGDASEDYSVGFTTRNVEIAVDGGEILVKTPHVAQAIHLPGDRTIRLDPDVFHSTNDLGHIRPNGELFLTGRAGETIKKGGEFLSLVEIENCALAVPGVTDALAIPCRSESWGQDFQLRVVLEQRDGSDVSALLSNVRQTLIRDLSLRARPQEITVEFEIVRTSSGKPLRRHYVV